MAHASGSAAAGQQVRRPRKLAWIAGGVLVLTAAVVLAVLGGKGQLGGGHKSSSDGSVTTTSTGSPKVSTASVTVAEDPIRAPAPTTTTATVAPIKVVLPPMNTSKPAQQFAPDVVAPVDAVKPVDAKPVDAVKPLVAVKQMGMAGGEEEDVAQGDGVVSVSGNTCYADDAEELKEAIEKHECAVVQLTNSQKYDCEDEIEVSRRVTVQGNPAVLPMLDGEEGPRIFRVKPGGFLELRYVRVKPSDGVQYTRADILNMPESIEGFNDIREAFGGRMMQDDDLMDRVALRVQIGGAVYFEPGAVGGLFVGVIFIEEEPLEEQIQLQEDMTVIRTFGEFIFMAAGSVDFVGCTFYDMGILKPFNPLSLTVGEWMMIVDGTATFTGCLFYEFTFFGQEVGLGLNFAVLGGTLFMNFCNMLEANLAVTAMAIGEAFLVGAGFAVYTGVDFLDFSALLFDLGTGPFTVIAGGQISTGVNNFEALSVGAIFGAGMEWSVGLGLSIMIGVVMHEIYGVFCQATAGEIYFLGAGQHVAIGSPLIEYAGVITENGAGGFIFIGPGHGVFIGCPVFDTTTVAAVHGVGEFVALMAGQLVWIGAPFIEAAVIEHLVMLGTVLYVGAGTLVIGATKVIEFELEGITVLSELHGDFFVNGGCEPESDVAPLPWFLGAWNVCEKLANGWWGRRQLSTLEFSDDEDNIKALPTPPSPHKKQQQPFSRLAAAKSTMPAAVKPVRVQSSFHSEEPDIVRRHATTMRDVVHPRLLQTQTQDSKNKTFASIEMFDVHKKKATAEDIEMLNLPEPVKQMARDTFGQLEHLRDSLNITVPAQQDPDNLVYLMHKTDGNCRACDVSGGGFAGPGGSTCDVSESCSADGVHAGGLSSYTPMMTDDGKINFLPQTAIMAHMAATTAAGIKVDHQDVQAAVIEALVQVEAQLNITDSIRVTVYSGEASLSPTLKSLLQLPPKPRSLLADAAHPETHHMKMAIVLTNKATADMITELITQAEVNEDASPFARLIKEELDTKHGLDVGSLGLGYDDTYTTPAYGPDMAKHAPVRNLGVNTVILMDPSRAGIPLSSVHYGTDYVLHLEQFPANTKLNVHLNQHTSFEDEPRRLKTMTATVDDKGEADMNFHFSEHDTGDYFFTVTRADDSASSHSPMYSLAKGTRRRKLYGPSVWI